MQIKRFSELTKEELNEIIEVHFNHWVKYNPQMMKENTIYKFSELYTKDELPLGFALVDDDGYLVGFCVLKKENLKKYPEISPWLSDVMIIEGYRGKGYGKILVIERVRIRHYLCMDRPGTRFLSKTWIYLSTRS